MKCTLCNKTVKNGVIEHGHAFCNEEHANKWWYDTGADNFAYEESQGELRSYNDYAEAQGYTMCDYFPETLKREQ